MKRDMNQLAQDIISQNSLSTDEIEELAKELLAAKQLAAKQRRVRVLKEDAVSSGVYASKLNYCSGCGRPL